MLIFPSDCSYRILFDELCRTIKCNNSEFYLPAGFPDITGQVCDIYGMKFYGISPNKLVTIETFMETLTDEEAVLFKLENL